MFNPFLYLDGGAVTHAWMIAVVIDSCNMSSMKVIIICKNLGFHGGDYEERCLLGCYAVWLL
jgi:hypothetical protein